jgi:hypothetical protein
MVASGHANIGFYRVAKFFDALIVCRDNHARCLALACLLIDMLKKRFARQWPQRFSRQT